MLFEHALLYEDLTEQSPDDLLERLSGMNLSSITLCIDFDGTCVTHDFPLVGSDVPFAVEVLQALSRAGAKLIVWTIRCDDPGSRDGDITKAERFFLSAAKDWFAKNDIKLYGANVNPSQGSWSKSPKAYCDFYIDDAAIGTPLIYGDHHRPYVDWKAILPMIIFSVAQRI